MASGAAENSRKHDGRFQCVIEKLLHDEEVVYNIREKAHAGVMALGAFAATRDPRCLTPAPQKTKHKISYAPAMLLGYLAYLVWRNLV